MVTAAGPAPWPVAPPQPAGVWVYYRARTQALASLGALIGCPPA